MKNFSLAKKIATFSISLILLAATAITINTIYINSNNQKVELNISSKINRIIDIVGVSKHIGHLKGYQKELTSQYLFKQSELSLPEHFDNGISMIREQLVKDISAFEKDQTLEELPAYKDALTSLDHFLLSMKKVEVGISQNTIDSLAIHEEFDSMTTDTIVLETLFDTVLEKELQNILSISVVSLSSLFSNWIKIALITFIVFIIITYLFARWFTKKIITPITTATTTAKEISNGNYDTEININNYEQSEIVFLLHALKSMAVTIKSQMNKIESNHRQAITQKEELGETTKRLERKVLLEGLVSDYHNIFLKNTDAITPLDLDGIRLKAKQIFQSRWNRRIFIDDSNGNWYSDGDLVNEKLQTNGLVNLTESQLELLQETFKNKEPIFYDSFESFSEIAGILLIDEANIEPSECFPIVPTHIGERLVALNYSPIPRTCAEDTEVQIAYSKVTKIGTMIRERFFQQYLLASQSNTTTKILAAAGIRRWAISFQNGVLLLKDDDIGSVFYDSDKTDLDINIDSLTTQKAIRLAKTFLTNIIQNKTEELNLQYKFDDNYSNKPLWRELKVLIIQPEGNGPGLLSGIIIDIDKQKTAILESEKNAKELKNSLNQLEKTQNQLVETEKQASLGRLVNGVAHEINTPIGLSITYTSFLRDQLATLTENYQKGLFKKSSFEKFCNTGETSLKETLTNLNRAGTLIENFKQIAVDQNAEIIKSFDLNEYIYQVTQSLSSKWNSTKYTVKFDYDSEIRISMESYAGPIMQILSNLVDNSITHGFQDQDSGCITISLSQDVDEANIVLTDNGKGMDENTLTRIFDPFFTTNMGGHGSGLGSHIVFNLVTRTLKGNISCTSSLGEGAQFNISIPRVIS